MKKISYNEQKILDSEFVFIDDKVSITTSIPRNKFITNFEGVIQDKFRTLNDDYFLGSKLEIIEIADISIDKKFIIRTTFKRKSEEDKDKNRIEFFIFNLTRDEQD